MWLKVMFISGHLTTLILPPRNYVSSYVDASPYPILSRLIGYETCPRDRMAQSRRKWQLLNLPIKITNSNCHLRIIGLSLLYTQWGYYIKVWCALAITNRLAKLDPSTALVRCFWYANGRLDSWRWLHSSTSLRGSH